MDERETKGERREAKRQMRVIGRSVRLLQDIVLRRAEKLLKKERDQ